MGSKDKRSDDLRTIVHYWGKIARRREWILRNVQEIFDIEREKERVTQEMNSQNEHMLRAWNEAVRKRNSAINKLRAVLKREKGMEHIANSIKLDKMNRDESALSRIKQLAERERELISKGRELAKSTKDYMEQCRLLMHYQKGKIDDFIKNL